MYRTTLARSRLWPDCYLMSPPVAELVQTRFKTLENQKKVHFFVSWLTSIHMRPISASEMMMPGRILQKAENGQN